MRVWQRLLLLVLCFLLLINVVYGGHEQILYPSFYPHEVRFFRVEKIEEASRLILQTNTTGLVKGLHLYLTPIKPTVKTLNNPKISFINEVDKLYYLVVNVNKKPWNDRAVTDLLINSLDRDSLAEKFNGLAIYIPILPYQRDYVYVADISESLRMKVKPDGLEQLKTKLNVTEIRLLAEEAEQDTVEEVVSELAKLSKVKVVKDDDGEWDFRISSISLNDFITKKLTWANGIYFDLDAYEGYTLATEIFQQSVNSSFNIQDVYNKILWGKYSNEFERMLLVRKLVKLGIEHGGVIPLFATYRRYMFNDDWDEGIYNMAVNPLTGPFTDVFYRTVKLKLFPWNGWLLVGHNDTNECNYNPFILETTFYCRALWMFVGDPALVHQPYNGSWEVNRVVWHDVERGALKVPDGSFIFHSDKSTTLAKSKVLYRVLLGKFHTDVEMGFADVLYSYYFFKKYSDQLSYTVRDRLNRLIAVRFLNITRTVIPLVGLNLTKQDLWLEVYLNYTHPDDVKIAAYLPPWTILPWELLSLVDIAVSRGRTISSINLVKDPQLPVLLKELKNANYVPDLLSEFVTQEETKHRWESLDRWFSEHGHLLVTNGPYYLYSDNTSLKVLKAFRSPSYPLGVGSYDYLSVPRFGKILSVEPRSTVFVYGENITINVKIAVENVEQAPRGYKSFGFTPSHDALVYSYLTDMAGNVLWLGKARPLSEKGLFTVVIASDVTSRLEKGNYTVHFAVVPSYKYFSWPATVNMMNPAYSSVSIMLKWKTDGLEARLETYVPYLFAIAGAVLFIIIVLKRSWLLSKVPRT